MRKMLDLDKLKLNIIHAKPTLDFNKNSLELNNKTYNFWVNFWKEFYSEAEFKKDTYSDDFYKSDFAVVLTYDGEIAAMTLGSYFNLDFKSTYNHSYFNLYHPHFLVDLHNRNHRNIIALESCAVSRDLQRSFKGVSFGQLIITLSVMKAQGLNCDGTIASIRSDIGMYESFGKALSFERLYKDYRARNFPLDLVLLEREKYKIPKDGAYNLVMNLWKNRLDQFRTLESVNTLLEVA